MPTVVYAKPTESYNTPNTTAEDTDKTSPCEVTADVHYAYYVSMPAALTLEPYDYDAIKSEYLKKCAKEIDEESGFTSPLNPAKPYWCEYSVKAKISTNGLNGKYICIEPGTERGLGYFNRLRDGTPFLENYTYLYNTENSNDKVEAWTLQETCYFGETMGRTEDNHLIIKVSSDKWSTIDAMVTSGIKNQGQYKGDFEFVYGLVDSVY